MKLTVLGCSGSVPAPDSPGSGYLLEAGGTRIGVELGNGTLGPMQQYCDPFDLDALFLSHLHADHCADVAPLTVLRRHHPEPPHDPRHERLPVYAPDGAAQRLAALYATSASELAETCLEDVFEFTTLSRTPVRIGAFEITPFPVHHVCPAWGFRIAADNAVLAFTGDTGPFPGLTELAAETDALLAEASWPHAVDAPDGVHLSGAQAGQLARTGETGRLLLTHVQPWVDPVMLQREAGEWFEGPIELVRPGAQYLL